MGVTKRAMWPMVLLILLACALWIPQLDHALSEDEAFTLTHYTVSLPRALGDYSEPNNHMLHSALIWGVHQVMPHDPLMARLPALVAAIMGLAVMYRLARGYLPALPALLATAWLLLTPDYSAYAIHARGYSLTMLAALAVWLWGILYPRPRVVLWSAFAMVLTLPTMWLLVIPALLWASRWCRRLIAPLLTGAIAASLFYLPSVVLGVVGFHASVYGYTDPLMLLSDVARTAWPPMLVVVAVFRGSRIQHQIGRWNAAQQAWIALVFSAALAISAIVWLARGTLLYDRNYLYLMPFIILPSVVGWWRHTRLVEAR